MSKLKKLSKIHKQLKVQKLNVPLKYGNEVAEYILVYYVYSLHTLYVTQCYSLNKYKKYNN